ncbi:hypothetical protein HMPREF1548_03857 [Clostridium sp. KLE 1755]|nr:hypothetical protein HMPREF1548_03857 [Clostridium sp. KLE 1755]
MKNKHIEVTPQFIWKLILLAVTIGTDFIHKPHIKVDISRMAVIVALIDINNFI